MAAPGKAIKQHSRQPLASPGSLFQVTYWQVWSALSLCPRSLQPHRPTLPTTHPTPTDTPSLPQTTTILHPLTPRPLLLSFIHLTLRVLCDALFSCSIAHSPFDSDAVWYCIHLPSSRLQKYPTSSTSTHTQTNRSSNDYLASFVCTVTRTSVTPLSSTLPSTRRRSAHHNILLFLGLRLDVLSLQRQRNLPAPLFLFTHLKRPHFLFKLRHSLFSLESTCTSTSAPRLTASRRA